MVSKRPLKGALILAAIIVVLCGNLNAQTAVDTLFLDLVPPDSVTVYKDGANVVIRWYAPPDDLSSAVGTVDLRNWISGYNPLVISEFQTFGDYIGSIDRKVRIERQVIGSLVPLTVGVDEFIAIRIETTDPNNNTFSRNINVGTNYYTPDELIPMKLVNEENDFDTLDLGFDISFGPGVIDTSFAGGGAVIGLDVQDFEGFHIWKGTKSPNPSEMVSIVEISKEDYFDISQIDVISEVPVKWLWLWEYFRGTGDEQGWPRYDGQGREYYEWIDTDVFAGFTYYYHVTCYDRGYFKGFFQYNKKDSYICDEPDEENPEEEPGNCPAIAQEIAMTVLAGGNTDDDMKSIYAVPNPFRAGTSEVTSPSYHNFPDNSIKFFNLPTNCEIRIFTVSGDLVWSTIHENPDGENGITSWPVTNFDGEDVSSGVYIYRCESDSGGSVYGRIIVIR